MKAKSLIINVGAGAAAKAKRLFSIAAMPGINNHKSLIYKASTGADLQVSIGTFFRTPIILAKLEPHRR